MKEFYLDETLFDGTEEEFLAVENFFVKEWKLNGKRHRDDGPAVIWSGGKAGWYQNGTPISELRFVKKINEQLIKDNNIYKDSFKEYVTKALNLNESEDLHQQIDQIAKRLKNIKELSDTLDKT